jgi:HAD superfamily hydrolase (TIGR01509 family)
MIQAVIFDMDGVLIDSVIINWNAYNKVLARYDIRIQQDQMHRYVGRSIYDQVAMFNADFGLDIDAEDFVTETSRLKEKFFDHIKPKAGVIALLDGLRQRGIAVAVGTSTSRAVAERRLQTAGIDGYFEVIITEDDVHAHKPDPEVYQTVANRLHLPAPHCVVIEDAPAGIAAARAAGMPCLAVQTAYTTLEQLASATAITASLADIMPEYLLQLGQ